MNSLEILLLALAMSVDAFMVAFSYGLIIKKNRFLASVKLAISTGLGQFLMPLIGWYGALLIHGYIENIDHWISFLVFVALGVNVIIEAFSPDEHKKLAKKLTGKIL